MKRFFSDHEGNSGSAEQAVNFTRQTITGLTQRHRFISAAVRPLVPTASTSCREVKKRTVFDPDLIQLSVEIVQTFFAKVGSNSASKLKSLVFIIEAHKQRTKIYRIEPVLTKLTAQEQ